MAKKDRTGKRKTRDQRKSVNPRIPELGYYLIVTDTQEIGIAISKNDGKRKKIFLIAGVACNLLFWAIINMPDFWFQQSIW